jgi:hypothetical protein
MKKELLKKLYLKEVITTLLLIIITTFYLKSPFDVFDFYKLKAEIANKIVIDISTFEEKNIDFSKVFNNSFYNTMPLTQIIEYKKQTFIYNLALYNRDGKQISNTFKGILDSTNTLYSLKKLKLDNNNTKYTLYQFLGVISVFFIITAIYFTIKFIKPNLLNYYIFIIVILYITNLIFLGLKSDKERLIENTLIESYTTNKLN